ncbi:UNVERIFIED_CONTAM: hypothetical protein BJ099_10429 [Lysinibacillus xylanilyticus]|uniref:Tn7-like element transposition protein TnsE n=1 Tax=Lysinibacillus xylanilyticus TaxID=582475 RepID=UPI000670D20A|nr:Tn7-like element transposition protein TnsE [Lysinibacillus xylanilyticus]
MKNNQWFIQTGFICKGNCQIIDLPIGVLPILKIGVPYQDGIPLLTQKIGTLFEVRVENFRNGRISKAIDVCRRLNYYLHKKPELMIQNIWSFESDEMIYHIPQTEIVRALFGVNKIMSNALFRPNGLELLVNRVSMSKDQLAIIDFLDDIPNSIVTDDFARYFGWIFLHPEMKKSYASVQSNLYGMMVRSSNSKGIPIEVAVPKMKGFHLAVRGIRHNNEVLILEWLGSDIVDPPFRALELHHKSIKKRIYSPGGRKTRLSNKEKNEDYLLNENNGERSREDTNQPVIETDPIQIAFRHLPIVNRVSNYEQKVNQGDEYISNVGSGGGIKQNIVGLDESIFGGGILNPLEFNSLEVTKTYLDYGLDKFMEMIRRLANYNPHLRVNVTLIYLPLGRKFSYLADGRRRICAVVKITSDLKKSYVIEVAVPDNHSISTLIIPSLEDIHMDEVRLSFLLKGLINKGGSWSNQFLFNIPHLKLKHMHDNIDRWTKKLLEMV